MVSDCPLCFPAVESFSQTEFVESQFAERDLS